MNGIDRYYDNYQPNQLHAPPVYSADNFRENLTELLRLKEMTQEEAARRCGVSQPVFNNWYQGRNEPNLYGFSCLCAGLEVEPNWLLSKHEPINRRKKTNDKA